MPPSSLPLSAGAFALRGKDVLQGIALLVCLLAWTMPASAEGRIVIKDIAGREVVLERPARRIILAQGRHLPALSLIHPNPVSIMAGWQSDMRRQDAATYAAFQRKFPALGDVPIVGDGSPGGLSVERVLSLQPDVVIASFYVIGGNGGSADQNLVLQRLESAGIPVVFVDFFANPLRNTAESISILGKVTGRDKEAGAFRRFYEDHIANLTTTIAAHQPNRPTVFMHAHAGGRDCCYSSGKGTFDDFITLAGGRNIAAGIIPGSTGQISLEYLLKANPDVYVATGGAHMASSGGLVLGSGVTPAQAHTKFAEILARPGFSSLSAVTSGHAHALWQMFNDSPAHIVALEWLAKWSQPDLFKDLDPNETMQRLNGFSAVPLEGTFWIDHP